MSEPFVVEPAASESAVILLNETGAIRTGHFVLSAGNHSREYVNFRDVYAHPDKLWLLCRMIAQGIHPDVPVDVVVGPARGGNDLSLGVAYWLSQFRFPKAKKDPEDSPILRVWTEKTTKDDFAIAACHRNIVVGKHILLVEDVASSSRSIQKVERCIREAGGSASLVVVAWNRGTTPIASLIHEEIPSYPPDRCPLCNDGIPVNTDIGHGKEFLAAEAEKRGAFGQAPYANR